MLNLPIPRLDGGKPHIVACPMSDEQQRLQVNLVERYERVRNGGVDPREDNALAITTDGRKLALDARMLSAEASDFSPSKVNILVDNATAIWRESAHVRGTQMIFCDMGVNPSPWGYSVYDELVRKLTARGITREQIAAIGDADSDAKKQVLFEKVRNGQIRILIGSTAKMGTGTNVQKRLKALHHLDAPWKPAEVEQREGRILRQGNENEEVAIFRYVTEGSFDAYMWQALETKARFISQVMTDENGLRRAEDIGGQELSYAEVKAIASGNPAVLTLAEADSELQRLTVLKKNHSDEQYLARLRLRTLPEVIADQRKRLANLTDDRKTSDAHADDPMMIGNRSVRHGDSLSALGNRLDELPEAVNEPRRVPLGVYRGLRFGIVLHPQFSLEIYLQGASCRRTALSRNQGPRAFLNALESLAGSYERECTSLQKENTIAETQLRDYQARLGNQFSHQAYLAQLTSLRDQLKFGLSGAPPEPGSDALPDASHIAERIKALKSSQAIDSTPARIGRRRTGGEEPVTSRIRRSTIALDLD